MINYFKFADLPIKLVSFLNIQEPEWRIHESEQTEQEAVLEQIRQIRPWLNTQVLQERLLQKLRQHGHLERGGLIYSRRALAQQRPTATYTGQVTHRQSDQHT